MTPNPLRVCVDAFEAIRDTIIGAKKTSKETRRAWFITHVEPLDVLMRKIYDDYALGFDRLAGLLHARAEPEEALSLLKEFRLPNVRNRQDVRATAEALADARRRRVLGKGLGERFYDLFVAVDSFQSAAMPEEGLSYYAAFLSAFESILRRGGNPMESHDFGISSGGKNLIGTVANLIDRSRQNLMPEAWGKYTYAYQRVRVECV